MSARPAVHLVSGLHITATDKRNILGCIAYLRTQADRDIWMGRKGSKKRYCLMPDQEIENRYGVLIEESEADSAGRAQKRTITVVVDITGITPLPRKNEGPEQATLL